MSGGGPGGTAPIAPLEGAAQPSPWIVRWSHLVPKGGAVLDIAAGSGRHARWFAQRGHPVVAIDRAQAALDALGHIAGVEPVSADLENGSPWPLDDARVFAAVVVTNYLYRPLLPRLSRVLAPGGVLLYETFARGNETIGKPSNPSFLLAPGELLEAVRGRLTVIAYEDGYEALPRPAFVQRICAALPIPSFTQGTAEGAALARYDLAG
ncbi:MAG: class I SAM-dependent methyltransferase [Trinickia sp.]